MERLASKEKFRIVYFFCFLFFFFLLSTTCKTEANHTEILKFEDILLSSNDAELEVDFNSDVWSPPTEDSVISDDLVINDTITDPLQIDADIIEYNEQSGVATAKGNVKVKNKNLILTSPYVEYELTNEIIEAVSDKTTE